MILRHIQQLRPVVQANLDVIAFTQTGLIGVWGEWYFSDNFGTGTVTATQTTQRGQVVTVTYIIIIIIIINQSIIMLHSLIYAYLSTH
jgi:hypothetical protein